MPVAILAWNARFSTWHTLLLSSGCRDSRRRSRRYNWPSLNALSIKVQSKDVSPAPPDPQTFSTRRAISIALLRLLLINYASWRFGPGCRALVPLAAIMRLRTRGACMLAQIL